MFICKRCGKSTMPPNRRRYRHHKGGTTIRPLGQTKRRGEIPRLYETVKNIAPKWGYSDSNRGPPVCDTDALTNWAISPFGAVSAIRNRTAGAFAKEFSNHGEDEIRTHGRGISPYTGLANQRDRPLRHLSWFESFSQPQFARGARKKFPRASVLISAQGIFPDAADSASTIHGVYAQPKRPLSLFPEG